MSTTTRPNSDAPLIIVSNRLPVERDESGSWKLAPGGLVTALQPVIKSTSGTWVGWTGIAGDEDIEKFSHEGMELDPIHLTTEQVRGYYEGFSNSTLWPLYHDLIVPPVFHRPWWRTYEEVNLAFAQHTAAIAPQGAQVWVQDYQLQRMPALLRALRPDLTIGFYLHIPFPAPDLFAQLPWRKQIIEGMLGADVIGFQRKKDANHFLSVAEKYSEATLETQQMLTGPDGRRIHIDTYPISIHTAQYEQEVQEEDIVARAESIRNRLARGKTLLLGVDRLDYTKGILHRLEAYEELLNEGSISPKDVVLVQVASPSREKIQYYRDIRAEVEETVGRINGTHGLLEHTPVIYLHQEHSHEETLSLFIAADVMIVSSLRDGMNLVAKEFVACKTNNQGALVLSEFAGAADELTESILINPHDIDAFQEALLTAINMPSSEQQQRMRQMRQTVRQHDVTHWAQRFLGDMNRTTSTSTSELAEAITTLSASPSLLVVCDIDGTIAPIARTPEQAAILPEARKYLAELHALPHTWVMLMSGRALTDIRPMLTPPAPFMLSGSHGAEFDAGDVRLAEASQLSSPPLTREENRVHEELQHTFDSAFSQEPGVRIEEKPYGAAVHVRQVPDTARANRLLDRASTLTEHLPVKQTRGKKVREFSVRHTNKGAALRNVREWFPETPVIYIGDDVTDESVFASLTSTDVGVKVGQGETRAHHRVADPTEVIDLLAELVRERDR